MSRRQRLKWLCTKKGRKIAAATQAERRGGNDHRYVVGRFVLAGTAVMLECVYCGIAWDIPRPPVFTRQAERFNRWRTRQAAHQFAVRYKLDCHVIDLGFLDVLPE